MTGALILVATPIGNLGDMSKRGIDALNDADVIACEDTRHTQKLLNHFDIHTKTMSLHEHNERDRVASVIDRVSKGETVALVSDAGMPAISDPGQVVVAAVAEAGFTVSVIPGASAVPAAVAVSGLATDRFCFEGFLPRKGGERRERLENVSAETRTTVIYESPNRIGATANDLAELCGDDRRVALVRELTKLHEEIWRGTLSELGKRAETEIKGECVLVLAGAPEEELDVDDDLIKAMLEIAIRSGSSKKDAVAEVAAELKVPKNRVYDISVS